MEKKKDLLNVKPSLAAGIDDSEELDTNASKEEIKNGEYTEVTKLSYDEVNPS